MHQVKIFENTNIYNLQRGINAFLSEFSDDKNFEIKAIKSCKEYVMILYKI